MDRMSLSKLNTWEFCRGAFYEQYILGLNVYNPDFDFGKRYHKEVERYHLGEPYDAEFISHYTGTCDCTDKLSHPSYPANYFGEPAQVEIKYIHTFTHPMTRKELRLPFSMILDGIRDEDLDDLKTSKIAWNQNMVDANKQATVYTYAYWQKFGEIRPFKFNVVRKNPGPKTKPIDEWTTIRTVEDFANFFDEAERVIYDIQSATEYPCTCRNQAHALKGVNA